MCRFSVGWRLQACQQGPFIAPEVAHHAGLDVEHHRRTIGGAIGPPVGDPGIVRIAGAREGEPRRAHLVGDKVVSVTPIVGHLVDGGLEQGTWDARPVDVRSGPDGAVYFSDDTGIRIFRLGYRP